jgi:NhaP-type Na+/H+ or K+/H+ antiporter
MFFHGGSKFYYFYSPIKIFVTAVLVLLALACPSEAASSSSNSVVNAISCPCIQKQNITTGLAADICLGKLPGNVSYATCLTTRDSSSTHEAHVAVPEVLLICVCLILGLIFRQVPKVPYTVLLLVGGYFFDLVIKQLINADAIQEPEFYILIGNLDPHVILFVFLPALIFESAFYTNMHVFLKQLSNVLLMAVPGVLLATFLTAIFPQFVMYGPDGMCLASKCNEQTIPWNIESSLLMGSILSATDPVAVVGLLKELGASERLSLLIEGESLLNDGTAVVLFTIFFNNMLTNSDPSIANEDPLTHQPKSYNVPQGIGQFFNMALFGILIGFLFGWIAKHVLHMLQNDAMSEVAITLVVAYSSFAIAESAFHVSGVLAVVAAGMYMALYRSEVSASVADFMHETWELLSYLLNTTLFAVTGILIAKTRNITGVDFWTEAGLCILLYLYLMLVRGICIITFSPCLKRWGYGMTTNELIIVWWGGLRGAVGLALAMIVSITCDESEHVSLNLAGQRILFQTGGIAFLTLTINGTTTEFLIKYLGMDTISEASKRMKIRATVRLHRNLKAKADALHSPRYHPYFKQLNGREWTKVWYRMPIHSQAVYLLRTEEKGRVIPQYIKNDIPHMYRQTWKKYRKNFENEDSKIAAREVLRSMISYNPYNSVNDRPKKMSEVKSEIDEELEMEEARRRFVQTAKGLYHEQFNKGFISTADAFSELMKAEDIALDEANTPMDQYDSHLKESVEIPVNTSCLNCLMKGPFRFVALYILRHHIKIAYEILSNFIFVHEHVISELKTLKSHEGVLGNKEALRLSYENKRTLDDAYCDLQEYENMFPEIIKDLSTKAAARVLLEHERSMTLEEYEEGELMANEMKEMMEETRKSMIKLRLEEEPWQPCNSAAGLPTILEIIQQNNRQHPYRTLGVVAPDALRHLVDISEEKIFDHGDVVFNSNTAYDGMYYVGRGTALLCAVLRSVHGSDNRARDLIVKMESDYNDKVAKHRHRRATANPKRRRKLSLPTSRDFLERTSKISINDDSNTEQDSIELTKSDSSIRSKSNHSHELKGFNSMQRFGKYRAQKERSTSAEDIAKIAEECGANADNEGILTDSELKTFMNVQKLFTSGTVSIVRTLQYGDVAGAWQVLDSVGSTGKHHVSMETENKLTAIFFPKDKIEKIILKNEILKKALWKEAAIEIISLYGIFDSTESGRSHHYHNIATMCHESSVILFNEDQGNVSIPHGYGAFVLSGKIQINEETKERYTYISAVAKDSDVKLSSNTVLLVVPPTALAVMKLKSPLLETQHDSLGRVLQSLAFSSKEEKMEILEAVVGSLTLKKVKELINDDEDFTKTPGDKAFVKHVLEKKKTALLDAMKDSITKEEQRQTKTPGRSRSMDNT